MQLDDKSTVNLFAALATAPFIIGGVLWLTSIDAKATKAVENAELIKEIHVTVIELRKDIEHLKDKNGKRK